MPVLLQARISAPFEAGCRLQNKPMLPELCKWMGTLLRAVEQARVQLELSFAAELETYSR
jgi:hypothetical protein